MVIWWKAWISWLILITSAAYVVTILSVSTRKSTNQHMQISTVFWATKMLHSTWKEHTETPPVWEIKRKSTLCQINVVFNHVEQMKPPLCYVTDGRHSCVIKQPVPAFQFQPSPIQDQTSDGFQVGDDGHVATCVRLPLLVCEQQKWIFIVFRDWLETWKKSRSKTFF